MLCTVLADGLPPARAFIDTGTVTIRKPWSAARYSTSTVSERYLSGKIGVERVDGARAERAEPARRVGDPRAEPVRHQPGEHVEDEAADPTHLEAALEPRADHEVGAGLQRGEQLGDAIGFVLAVSIDLDHGGRAALPRVGQTAGNRGADSEAARVMDDEGSGVAGQRPRVVARPVVDDDDLVDVVGRALDDAGDRVRLVERRHDGDDERRALAGIAAI